jgi:hypothetical protein
MPPQRIVQLDPYHRRTNTHAAPMLLCGNRYPLAVQGIETARRVADHQQPCRECRHLVIASPDSARVARDGHLSEGLADLLP